MREVAQPLRGAHLAVLWKGRTIGRPVLDEYHSRDDRGAQYVLQLLSIAPQIHGDVGFRVRLRLPVLQDQVPKHVDVA